MKSNKSVTLARVSSRAQEDGYSLDAQSKLIKNYCEMNDLKFVKEFRISETASKNQERKIFGELLEYIGAKKINHLIVEKTDRLTRNFRDAVIVDDWLEADEDRRLHMVKEGLIIHKNAKSDAKMMWNIYLAIAKKYTDNLREEAMKGWDEKLAQGWMPSQPPAGYKNARQHGRTIHVINEDTAFMIERAFRLFLEPGQCVRKITVELAECGLVNTKSKPFGQSAVHKILRNPYYMGVIRFNGKLYQGAHEPIVDEDLFEAVQNKLSRGANRPLRKHNPLFKGFMRCSICNRMVSWTKQKGRYYGSCNRMRVECKQHSFLRQDRVEDAVLQRIDNLKDENYEKFRTLKKMLLDRKRPFAEGDIEKILKLQRAQVKRLQVMLDNLYDDKLADVIDEDMYEEKVTYYNQRIRRLQKKVTQIESYRSETSESFGQASRHALKKLYLKSSYTEKRILINELFLFELLNGQLRITNKM